MKKLLLSLLMAAGVATATQARELRFYIGDQQITDGATINVSEYTATAQGPFLNVVMAPELKVWCDYFTNGVTVKAECTTGEQIQMCCGGECAKGTTVTKSGLSLQSKKALPLEFEYQNRQQASAEVPTLTVVFTASDSKNSTVAPVTFTLVIGPNAAGLNSVETDHAISVSGNRINYNIAGSASVEVYNLLGTKALGTTVSGEGSVDLRNLGQGVYIYMVRGEGLKQSGKVLVK